MSTPQKVSTPEERVEYFEFKLGYWERKLDRLLSPPKIKHAKTRVAHYTAKLKAEQKLVKA